MPSKNPRLSVVLAPAVAQTLAALSAETGDSAASVVRNLLDQAHPALERMLQLVRAAKSAQGQIADGVGQALQRVVDDLEDAQALAQSRADRVVRDLVDQAQAVRGRRRRGGAALAATGATSTQGFPLPPAKVQAFADTNGIAPEGGSTPVPVTRGSGPRKAVPKDGRKGVRRG